jgi:hypothetical protein
MNRPGEGHGEGEDNTNGARLNDWTKRLIVIDAFHLRKPTEDPTRLIPNECAIRIVLVAKHPLATDNVGIGGMRDQAPSVVL